MLMPDSSSIYLILGNTDMRKSIDTLALQLGPFQKTINIFDGSMFVFCNKRKNILKILFWDRNGFCLMQKRLDKIHFDWPDSKEELKTIKSRELRWLIDGIKISDVDIKGDVSPECVI